MIKKGYGFMLFVAMISGAIGGIVGGRFFMSDPVFAAKAPKPQKVIMAEKFVLVDENGVSRAVLGQYSKNKVAVGRVALILQDEEGNARRRTGGNERRDYGSELLQQGRQASRFTCFFG